MCKSLSFEDCELAILRTVVDKAEKIQGKEIINTPEIKQLIQILESFLKKKKCIVYGGTAINNILPKNDQFYDYSYEIPDYDFYSPDALDLSIELADIYFKAGFTNVEAKAGVHHGTFKVFVNNIGIADITYLHPDLFKAIQRDAIEKDNILYAPVNFLRQSMYLELSSPRGDVSRWEKVLKRLNLLNKHFPLKAYACKVQREFSKKNKHTIFNIVRNIFIQEKNIFIGGYANALYSKYSNKPNIKAIPDFDILSEDPVKSCELVKHALETQGITDISIEKYEPIGELIAEHYSISIKDEYIAFIYKPNRCLSYNSITIGNNLIRVGTIDTLLNYYLAFLYANRPYHDPNRLLCMSKYLFEIQQHNRLKQKGLLRRFSTQCFGIQPTLNSIREEKMKKFKTLKKETREYKEYFLKYTPKKTRKTKSI